jgi:glycyl-tRNA synthetase (class II)
MENIIYERVSELFELSEETMKECISGFIKAIDFEMMKIEKKKQSIKKKPIEIHIMECDTIDADLLDHIMNTFTRPLKNIEFNGVKYRATYDNDVLMKIAINKAIKKNNYQQDYYFSVKKVNNKQKKLVEQEIGKIKHLEKKMKQIAETSADEEEEEDQE